MKTQITETPIPFDQLNDIFENIVNGNIGLHEFCDIVKRIELNFTFFFTNYATEEEKEQFRKIMLDKSGD